MVMFFAIAGFATIFGIIIGPFRVVLQWSIMAHYRSLGAARADEPGQGGNPAAISRSFRVSPAI